MEATTIDLVRTRTGGRLHLIVCPHMRDVTDYVTATPDERAAVDVCAWCRKEIAGEGRIPCVSLEEAMREFRAHPESMELIRAALADVEHDEIWLPRSRSYIALGRERLAVAWVLKTFIGFRDRAQVTLPGYDEQVAGSGATSVAGAERRGQLCPHCFMEMPVAGRCDCGHE